MQLATSTSREERVQDFLRQHRLRAWISWRPDELLMMTGYLPFWGASVLLYFEHEQPVLIVPVVEPRDRIPSNLRVREYPWGDPKCADSFAVLIEIIREELKRAGVDSFQSGMLQNAARTSLPMQAAEQVPIPESFRELLAQLTAKLDPTVDSDFLDLYLRKSPPELEGIRLANHVAAVGIQAFFESLTAGLREIEIAAAVERAIQVQGGRGCVSYSRAWAMVQSGPNTADSGCFNRSTGRTLEDGDLVLLELGACVNGYWSDLTRTAAVGTVKPELQRVLATVRAAQEAAIEAVRPGVCAGEVDTVARDTIASYGFSNYFNHATGHHVGFRYHDPGFGIAPGEYSKLQPGMVITVEPGVYVREYGGGARIEDNVLVTESGHEVLSHASRKN